MMNRNKKLIIPFSELTIRDVPLVGGKNAALGEMYQGLTPLGINIPDGFAVTAHAYRLFLEESGLDKKIKGILGDLDTHDIRNLQKRGLKIRRAVMSARMPAELEDAIREAYRTLEKKYGRKLGTAVRSSATAEDLPGASFAGQQETYLNISGERAVLRASKKCIASLFTDRAISYRADKGFSHLDTALSVGVQVMVRSDKAASGVAFTIDTESGFDKVVMINGIYGLGEYIVQGKVIPDEFVVFKPGLEKGKDAVIARNLGDKKRKLVYGSSGTKDAPVPEGERNEYCLNKKEVIKLARWCVEIERHFSEKHGRYQPMDIEWAKDGITNELFIVQARPETVHSSEEERVYREYRMEKTGSKLVSGIAVGAKIGSGKVRVIRDVKGIRSFQKGEVLVTEITDPDWEPIMKIASAIVTDKGGRTSHAAIVSRELGIPCAVGTENATKVLKTGTSVTVDCASGEEAAVYEGEMPFEVTEHRLDKIPETRTKIMVNVGSPGVAFSLHNLPVKGVGLGRLEFIIASHVGIHPNALIEYPKLKNRKEKNIAKIVSEIEKRTPGYKNKADFYVDELSEGIAKIAASFWPHEVIIRFSDFKTNEYRKLVGGELYEPQEENPMLGWRGASRYYDPKFQKAFSLECKALRRVRHDFGLENVVPMVPFCRTVEEGEKVLAVMAKNGLDRKKDKALKVYVMCEIPSNVILADDFLKIFDGMSIGSNDLTQLTLGLDRDSGIVSGIGNEKDDSVKELIARTIRMCRKKKKYVGICGQGPSDYPDFAEFLVEEGIESMSLNPDTVIKTLLKIAKKEKKKS